MTKNIKITFLTDRMIKGHGVDLVVDRVADGLAAKGYLAEVYANHVDETFTNRKSYRIFKLPPIGLGNFFILEQRVRKFADFFNSKDTDLFIIQSFPFYSLIPKLKKPCLVVDHGIISTEGLPLKRRIFHKYMQVTQNLSYFRKAKKVVCVSKYLLSQLPPYIRKKAIVIYNGVDHYAHAQFEDTFTDKELILESSEIEQFRESLGLKEDDILLLYVGRLNLTNQPYKGLAELVDIFQQVSFENNKIKLLAVGYGSRNDEELLKNEGILCIANAPESTMPLIYSACDIYTTCSKWEGFDLPVGEAQYFGKPVICYNIGAHPEVMVEGKTGYIVSTKDEFTKRIIELSKNSQLRKLMGKNSKEFVKKFYWKNSIESYDIEIKKILEKSSSLHAKFFTETSFDSKNDSKSSSISDEENDNKSGNRNTNEITDKNPDEIGIKSESKSETESINKSTSSENMSRQTAPDQDTTLALTPEKAPNFSSETSYKKVSIIIVNYNSSYWALKECIDSLLDQTYKNIEIIIFDNNSSNNTLELISKKYLPVSQIIKIIKNNKNIGLGEAINIALKHASGQYVLISNFDVTYDKIAIEELVDNIYQLDNRYVGLAPKIKLYYQKEYIESVGVYIDNNFYLGYNGIGQLDLDQYNKPEDVFGVSFTSAFLKRDFLCQNVLGIIEKPIDGNYFLFYEDIDFCYRANLLGYKFRSCPTAVCYHKYAYSFRDEATAFERKYYYQKLNVLKLVYKNAELANMKRVIKNEIGIQKQNLKDKNLRKVARKIMRDFSKSKPYLKKQRPYIQITRQIPDSEIIKFSWGENNFFDVVRNEPIYCIPNLILTYKRLFIITGNRKYEEYINYLHSLNDIRFRIQPEYLRKFLHNKLEYEPKPIHEFIDKIS